MAEGLTDPLAGTDPIDWEAIPFGAAESVVRVLATSEADLWIDWFLGSGLVDAGTVTGGGPDGLDEIWAGVLRAIDAGWFGSCTWDELVLAGRVPLWCRLRPGFEPYFGAAGCWVTAGAVASACRWMERELGSTWVLPEDLRGHDRSEPVLATPGGWRGIVPYSQFVGSVARAVGIVPGRIDRSPGRLRELIDLHAPEEVSSEADELVGPLVSSTGRDGRWMVGFSDEQAYDEDDRIDRFVEVLSLSSDVRVHREDRELVIVETLLDRDGLQARADTAWAAALEHPG